MAAPAPAKQAAIPGLKYGGSRQAAYKALMAEAAARGDNGASEQMTREILNRVDLGGSWRAGQMWKDRSKSYNAGAAALLDSVAAAYAAQRAKRGSGGGGSGGGGGGGGSTLMPSYYQEQPDWLEQYLASLAPSPAPDPHGAKKPVRRVPGGMHGSTAWKS